jgi:hypothetical protein
VGDEKQIHTADYNGHDRRAVPANVREMLHDAVNRQDDLRDAETRRVNELICLRDKFQDKLDVAEAKRIDAIRAVDVNAVTVANDKSIAQAAVLARQVTESAETLRKLVESTASTAAAQLVQLITPITERLGKLEQYQFKGEGRAGISTPLVATLATLVGGMAVFLIERAMH